MAPQVASSPAPTVTGELLSSVQLTTNTSGPTATAAGKPSSTAPEPTLLVVPESNDSDDDDDFVDAEEGAALSNGAAPVPQPASTRRPAAAPTDKTPAADHNHDEDDEDFGAFDEAVDAKLPRNNTSSTSPATASAPAPAPQPSTRPRPPSPATTSHNSSDRRPGLALALATDDASAAAPSSSSSSSSSATTATANRPRVSAAKPPTSPSCATAAGADPAPGATASRDDPDLARLRERHIKRQTARRGHARAASVDVASVAVANAAAELAEGAGRESGAAKGADVGPGASAKIAELQGLLAKTRAEHQTELQSLRRNHLENINKLTADRDMFAGELAKEQGKAKGGDADEDNAKRVRDLSMHLRAARIRTADLQGENSRLVEEAKQLRLRDAAHKALSAESDVHDSLIEELVATKVRCAQLEEEKEEERRKVRELTTSVTVLTEANGELEKSRAEWVFRMASIEEAAKAAGVDLSAGLDASRRPTSSGSVGSSGWRTERNSNSSSSSEAPDGTLPN